jgi:phosphopantetheinyl transferase
MTSAGESAGGRVPPGGAVPEPATVHVWVLDLTAPWCDALADAGVVSGVERARAERMTRPEHGRRLLARRSAMRFVLGRYLGRNPGAVEVVAAPGGKPVLVPTAGSGGRIREGPPSGAASGDGVRRTPAFSVGCSGDLYGVAIGSCVSVGLDIERRRSVPRAAAIARRWFGSREARGLEGLSGEEFEREFMRLWTGKEALAKRHGAGLRLMMRGDVDELDTLAAEAEGRLRWLTPRPGYEVAVASSESVDDVLLVVPEDDGWIG